MNLSVSDREAPSAYPARDFLCLDCVVAGGCNPQSQLCLWRADHSEPPDEREAQLLSAVDQASSYRELVHVAEVAQLVAVPMRTVRARIRRAAKAGLLVQEASEPDGVRLTSAGRARLAQLQDDRPRIELNSLQRGYYDLLATVRDLEGIEAATGERANRNSVTASAVGSVLGRRRRAVAATLRRLAELELVAYDFGRVSLADAGRHLVETLRAYTVNVRLGPRVAIVGRGRVRTRYLRRRRQDAANQNSANQNSVNKSPGDSGSGDGAGRRVVGVGRASVR